MQRRKGWEHPLGEQGCAGEKIWALKAKQGPYRKSFTLTTHLILTKLEGHKPCRNQAPSVLTLGEHPGISYSLAQNPHQIRIPLGITCFQVVSYKLKTSKLHHFKCSRLELWRHEWTWIAPHPLKLGSRMVEGTGAALLTICENQVKPGEKKKILQMQEQRLDIGTVAIWRRGDAQGCPD